jgi:hypothetical protein
MKNEVVIRMVEGAMSQAEREAFVRESVTPLIAEFAERYRLDEGNVRELCEAYTGRNRRFSFMAIEQGVRVSEGLRNITAREAITTSQAAAAIGLVVIHQIMDTYTQTPAIFRDLAEIETSNGDSEVYPEEFYDDLPVPTAETEPAPESRMGAGVVRIKNYVYTRALAISKRYFELDKTGQTRRFANAFGSKYPIAQDRAFVNGIFRAYTGPTNLIAPYGSGIFPPTNIAGQISQAAGYVSVPAGYAPKASQVTPQALEDALVAPAYFVDPYGIEIGAAIEFDTWLGDSSDRLKVKRFMQAQYTSVIAGAPGSDSTGQQPGVFTDNVLKGEFQIAHSPYVKKTRAPLSGNGYPWACLKAKQFGGVLQDRKPWSVTQENPMAGQSFDARSFRWQGEGEFGTGMRTGRKIYIGN